MRTTFLVTAVCGIVLLAGCGKKEATPTNTGKAAEVPAEPPAPAVDRLAEALKKAKAEEKNVLVEYYDVTCPFCTRMDREVYPDEFVKDALGQIVYVRLNRGKDAKPFEDRWGRMPTPTFIVLAPDGNRKGEPVTGFLGAGALTDLADWVANPEGDMPAFDPGGA